MQTKYDIGDEILVKGTIHVIKSRSKDDIEYIIDLLDGDVTCERVKEYEIVGKYTPPKKIEMVNHPMHYNTPGKKECIVEMEELFGKEYVIVFCLMTCYKYLYRAGEKQDNSIEQDHNKAKWYFEYADKLAQTMSVDERQSYVDLYLYIRKEILRV